VAIKKIGRTTRDERVGIKRVVGHSLILGVVVVVCWSNVLE